MYTPESWLATSRLYKKSNPKDVEIADITIHS